MNTFVPIYRMGKTIPPPRRNMKNAFWSWMADVVQLRVLAQKMPLSSLVSLVKRSSQVLRQPRTPKPWWLEGAIALPHAGAHHPAAITSLPLPILWASPEVRQGKPHCDSQVWEANSRSEPASLCHSWQLQARKGRPLAKPAPFCPHSEEKKARSPGEFSLKILISHAVK